MLITKVNKTIYYLQTYFLSSLDLQVAVLKILPPCLKYQVSLSTFYLVMNESNGENRKRTITYLSPRVFKNLIIKLF